MLASTPEVPAPSWPLLRPWASKVLLANIRLTCEHNDGHINGNQLWIAMNSMITLSFEDLTRDEADALSNLLRAWNDLVPTLYFLDSCSISRLKDELAGRRQSEKKHREHVNLLRSIDKSQNGISCLLALMEKASDQQNRRSLEEMKEEGERDRIAMENFFSQARVIESQEAIDQIAEAMLGKHPEELGATYYDFLAFASHLGLHQRLTPSAKLPTVEKLCTEAVRLGLKVTHPVVLTIVAIIYGCSPAGYVVKFTEDPAKFKASNALGDIQLLQRSKSFFSAVALDERVDYKQSRLISDDLNLNIFAEILNITCARTEMSEDGMSHEMSSKPDLPRLLPDIFDKDGIVIQDKSEEFSSLMMVVFGAT